MPPLSKPCVPELLPPAPGGRESVASFMRRAAAAYYARQEPFGPSGDFITAPEVSPLFGEIIALRIAAFFTGDFTLFEAGPGRGTLSLDILHTFRRLRRPAPRLLLHEFSERLRTLQRNVLPTAEYIKDPYHLPTDRPLCMIANEFFDALPAEVPGTEVISTPEGFAIKGEGTAEYCPEGERLWQSWCGTLKQTGGLGIIIDYGYLTPPGRLTLRGFNRHTVCEPTDRAGTVDITADVNFGRLYNIAVTAGLQAQVVAQGHYLQSLGIAKLAERAAQRGADRQAIAAALSMLCDREQMGERFKVLEVSHGL